MLGVLVTLFLCLHQLIWYVIVLQGIIQPEWDFERWTGNVQCNRSVPEKKRRESYSPYS